MKSLRQIWKFMTTDEQPVKRKYLKHTKRPYNRVTNSMRKRVLKLRATGMLYKDISKKVGVAPSTISDIINDKKHSNRKRYTIGDKPYNTKMVYERHQKKLRMGDTRFLPQHHLCPVCNPNSTTTWKEYFLLTHSHTMSHARNKLEQSNKSQIQEFSMSNY